MITLGISGSLYSEVWSEPAPQMQYRTDFDGNHDASAVLIHGGEVIAAVEQERVDRIKHSGSFPIDAIKRCFSIAGIKMQDVNTIALSYSRRAMEHSIARLNGRLRSQQISPIAGSPEERIRSVMIKYFGLSCHQARFQFFKHHLCHAASAFYPSRFDKALIASLDGQGEDECGSIFVGSEEGMDCKISLKSHQSLGHFYLRAISFLGFRLFDEYKAMGLAPYGDPEEYRARVNKCYTLGRDGDFFIHFDRLDLLGADVPVRGAQETFTSQHMNFSASIQEALESMVLHVLSNAKTQYQQTKLCLAGGVAHNCSCNGKLVETGIFENIYVQPAANDAGLALGAAILADTKGYSKNNHKLSVYLGTPTGNSADIEAELLKWGSVIQIEKKKDVYASTAKEIAQGAIIGWVRGRSEFGPRALGNRCILADARPIENKDIINEMIKKRESFRPFAPAVLSEYAANYFDLVAGINFDYMTFTVRVRVDAPHELGAVRHVNGTSRIQTVNNTTNPTFYRLINQFYKITGCPVLLCTSFNNSAEPIVDTLRDAVACLLTTRLHLLVVGDYFVRRQEGLDMILNLKARIPQHFRLRELSVLEDSGMADAVYEIFPIRARAGALPVTKHISKSMFLILSQSREQTNISETLDRFKLADSTQVLKELYELWQERWVIMEPNPTPQ